MTGAVPFFAGGGGGVGRKAGAAGGGGGASSLRYAEGAQPFLPEAVLANHQPKILVNNKSIRENGSSYHYPPSVQW
jgi:hypothetical protein